MYKEFAVENKWFNKIKNGTKTIEIRVNSTRRRHLKTNDLIKIKNESTNELLLGKITKIHNFPTFKMLFEALEPNKLGFDSANDNNYEQMYNYYTKEQEKENGVIGVEFELTMINLDDIDNFVFDMDGTLLDEKSKPVPENLAMIQELQKQGKKIAICTGRPYFTLQRVLTQIEPDYPIVAANGAMIYDNHTKEMVHFMAIEKHDAQVIFDFLMKENFEFVIYTAKKMYGHCTDATDFFSQRKYYNALRPDFYTDIDETFNPKDHEISKFLILTESRPSSSLPEMEILANKFPNMHGVYSRHDMYDIMHKDASKGNGLLYLAKTKGLNLERTIVFGDSENDISMFIQAKYSGAMANGFVETRKHSLFECDDHNTPWFANFVNKVLDKKQ
ncbi:Cof-type HAD-IIB family hydrolase [Mycoplasmopsis glycophila]|uniref:Putative phosphotransferase n=1 Tax=Mycoplasmopsis glycophila TaxID=171285 RepID=A0A449AW03_9BACT|nr:Cof-type HAD-IIB family hydrolase [Mycoplasmopsis glycophila]VEU70861.1 putative phosphotransferase [Mycoplasmopsis glycophila]